MTSDPSRVITRFAPSPTGFLHIGSARTALFNWLFSRHHGGEFRLRIEDTDRKRSTKEATMAIIEGLAWLGIDHDHDIVYQSQRAERHVEAARALLAAGRAYHCYCTPEELEEMREAARAAGRPMRYDGRWRDRDPAEAPKGIDPVVRLKMPQEGETSLEDMVQGRITVANEQLDDMILLRADGTPTYMLSVVVDDHDMDVSHVIRGDDHLTNAFRQFQLYQALDWAAPAFAHIPLIHGPDGAKLSKRHGALGVESYREMGYLPEALCNYLLRLGWGHGDDEIITRDQAIDWFDLDGVGKSAARFDFAKLESLNGHYLRSASNDRLVALILPLLSERLARPVDPAGEARLHGGMEGLKARAKLLTELAENAVFYVADRPIEPNAKARKLLADPAPARLAALLTMLRDLPDWQEEDLEQSVRDLAARDGLKLGDLAQPLRAALTGSNSSPGIFEVMAILGRNESLARLADCAK